MKLHVWLVQLAQGIDCNSAVAQGGSFSFRMYTNMHIVCHWKPGLFRSLLGNQPKIRALSISNKAACPGPVLRYGSLDHRHQSLRLSVWFSLMNFEPAIVASVTQTCVPLVVGGVFGRVARGGQEYWQPPLN